MAFWPAPAGPLENFGFFVARAAPQIQILLPQLSTLAALAPAADTMFYFGRGFDVCAMGTGPWATAAVLCVLQPMHPARRLLHMVPTINGQL